MYNAKEFGLRLKQLREQAGMTQEQLADVLHISTDYESKLENGKRNASVELCIQAAELLATSLDYLLLGRMPTMGGVKKVIRDAIQELTRLESQLP